MALKLHDYQRLGRDRLQDTNRHVLSYGTGLGKSATAITAAKSLVPLGRHAFGKGSPRILVICPAIVRRPWVSEFDKWASIVAHPIEASTGNKQLTKEQKADLERAHDARVQIASYSLAHTVTKDGWDAIILDECHRLQSPDTRASQICRELIDLNPSAMIAGLSATLAPDRVHQAWGPLDAIWRGRFGTQSMFKKRYMEMEMRSAGGRSYPHYFGAQNTDELTHRLDTVSHRVTREEVAHLLPAFDVSSLVIPRQPHQEFLLGNEHELLLRAGQEKLTSVLKWHAEAKRTSSHRCIAVHHRSLAREIAQSLNATLITGALAPAARSQALEACRMAADNTMVVTMDSTGIGIDLTFCQEVLIAEMSHRPEQLIQFLGRFSRLSGHTPANVRIMIIEGTIDDVIASRVLTKLEALNTVIKPDQAGELLTGVLDLDSESWLEDLEAALKGETDETALVNETSEKYL